MILYYIVSPKGEIMYSEVKTFLKKQSTLTGMYMSITTSLNTTVRLTSNHLIYSRKNCDEKFNSVYVFQHPATLAINCCTSWYFPFCQIYLNIFE